MRGLLLIVIISSLVSLAGQNLLNQPESIVYDQINDRYLVSNFGDGTIVQIDSEGEQSYFSTELTRLAALYIYEDMLLAASNLDPYVGLVGFDLYSDVIAIFIPILGSSLLNDITSDTEGNIYITDYWDTKIYKIDMETQEHWIYAVEGLNDPNGLYFDEINDRLITTSHVTGTYPLHGVSLADSSVSVVIDTYIPSQDGIARDNNGNYYLSSWYYNACYRFDPDFSEPAEMFSSNHSGPADIYCDNVNNLLCVPNFNSNSVEFIPIDLNNGDEVEIPEPVIELSNFPNPFNPSTTISFTINSESADLEIFNIKGQKIIQYSIFNNQSSITWDGTDDNGAEVPAGLYFYTITSNKVTKTKKMILLK